MTQAEFLKKYAHCAEVWVLDKIWRAKESGATELNVREADIWDLSPLSGLLNLRQLYCSDTQVSDLSPLSGLLNLRQLDCSDTQVSDLSPLSGLLNLRQLDCSDTQVSDLSTLSGLLNLRQLDCCYTQVSDLTPLLPLIEKGIAVKWKIWDGSDGIYTKGCPLSSPPIEIIKQGNEAILRWFAENRRVGTQKVNEARLLLLGQGGSGKTTLKEKLRDRHAPMPEPDDTTRGINIELLPHASGDGSEFTVHVWDFGGQNIQKYAHQFFLSDSVVYAVLSNEREQNPNFQYWLNIIELLGKDSPVYIVQNEFTGHAEPLKDVAQIQERFPQTFRSVEQVNLAEAATDPRFEALKLKLFHEATRLPHTQKEYLTSFVNVRRKLQALAETEPSIPFKQFKQLCRDEGISDELLMQDYAHTFTFLGIALHFHDDIFLKTSVFLRPKWMIDALFQLLYHEKVEQQAGRFSEQDADDIWADPEYDYMHGTLLRLMERFHLCYRIEGTKDYIVPQRLPARTEAFAPPEDNTQVAYRYKFMPSGILTQLTCRLHHRIEGGGPHVSPLAPHVWSDAVQFSDKNTAGRVFVRELQAQHFLEINAFGAHKADMLNQVVDILDDIHANTKFGNLRVEKLVPCPCAECALLRSRREEAAFFDYDFLLKLLREGETESDRCRQSMRKFPIREILKNAEVRVFKVEHIRELIAADEMEAALRLLRGQFEDNSEVIVQMGRLSQLERAHRTGQLAEKEYRQEKSRISAGVLATLQALER
jgi:internalin A